MGGPLISPASIKTTLPFSEPLLRSWGKPGCLCPALTTLWWLPASLRLRTQIHEDYPMFIYEWPRGNGACGDERGGAKIPTQYFLYAIHRGCPWPTFCPLYSCIWLLHQGFGIGAIIYSHHIGKGTGVQRSDSFLSSLGNLTLGSRWSDRFPTIHVHKEQSHFAWVPQIEEDKTEVSSLPWVKGPHTQPKLPADNTSPLLPHTYVSFYRKFIADLRPPGDGSQFLRSHKTLTFSKFLKTHRHTPIFPAVRRKKKEDDEFEP